MDEIIAMKLPTSKPHINGNAIKRTRSNDMFNFVFRSSDGREKICQMSVCDMCLYDVAVGDFIAVMEFVDGTLCINNYRVQQITDHHAVAISAAI